MYYSSDQRQQQGCGCAGVGLGADEGQQSGRATTWIAGGILAVLAIGVAVVDAKRLIPLPR
jgi:hypothetical protein